MVVAKFTMDEKRKMVSLHVKGHAGHNVPGCDIVCASASILAYTVAQTVLTAHCRGILKYKPTIKMKEGDSVVSCRCKDNDAYFEMLHSFIVVETGYQVLAHNYPQYVAVEMFGDSEQLTDTDI